MLTRILVTMAVLTATVLVAACGGGSGDPQPTVTLTPPDTPVPVPPTASPVPPTLPPPAELSLTRGSFDEVAPFAGVFVLDLNARTWLHIDEEPSRAPAPFPSLLATSPDGQHIAVGTSSDDVKLLNLAGDEVRSWRGIRAFGGAFSPNGRYLVLVNSADAVVLDVETGDVIQTGIEDGTWNAEWAEDGQTLLLGTGGGRGPLVDGEIYVYSIESGESEFLATGLYPSWSPDGERIAFAQEGGLRVVTASGTPMYSWSPPEENFYLTGVSWSGDGSRLIASLITFFEDPRRAAAAVLSAANGVLEYTVVGTGGLGISPDGQYFIAVGSGYDLEPQYVLFRPDGSDLRRLERQGSFRLRATSPDGAFVLVSELDAQGGRLVMMPTDGSDREVILQGPAIIFGFNWNAADIVTFRAASMADGGGGPEPETTRIIFPD